MLRVCWRCVTQRHVSVTAIAVLFRCAIQIFWQTSAQFAFNVVYVQPNDTNYGINRSKLSYQSVLCVKLRMCRELFQYALPALSLPLSVLQKHIIHIIRSETVNERNLFVRVAAGSL